MHERSTVRVLLFDPAGRILLMRGGVRFSARPRATWFPIGGGIEPGESLVAAAQREIAEETGLSQFELGPIVWFGEGVFQMGGRNVLFHETFMLARTRETDLSSDGWDESERQSVAEMRWWTGEEVRNASVDFYPGQLPLALNWHEDWPQQEPERITLV